MKLVSGQWCGDTLNTGNIAGLTLSETAYRSNLTLPPHSHEQAYFCLVVRGAFTERLPGAERMRETATLIFHPADERHSDHFHRASRCFNVQMAGGWMERLHVDPGSLVESRDFDGGILPRLAARLYEEFTRDDLSDLIVEGLALEMVGEICRPLKRSSRRAPGWLSTAEDLLRAEFADHLSLSQIAARVNVHPVNLAREFRGHHSCTIGTYIQRLRVEYACGQLIRSDLSLSEIALTAGFFDQSHFARTFKAHTGKTPREYRGLFQGR